MSYALLLVSYFYTNSEDSLLAQMFRCYDDLTRAVMIRNKWQLYSYISFILIVSPASFNFCLTGQPNDEKKEDGLEIYIVPQDSSHTKKKKKILEAAYCSCL